MDLPIHSSRHTLDWLLYKFGRRGVRNSSIYHYFGYNISCWAFGLVDCSSNSLGTNCATDVNIQLLSVAIFHRAIQKIKDETVKSYTTV